MKQRIKTTIITLSACSLLNIALSSYQPTDSDKEQLNSLTTQIITIINNDLPTHYSFVRQINTLLKTYSDNNQRIHYLLKGLYDHFWSDLSSKKQKAQENRNIAYGALVRRHESALTTSKPLPTACYRYIDDLDMLAFVHNTSLPLLIATRYREYTCGYGLPANTRGPMQIISKNYGTGAIQNHEQFITIMEDYINFAKSKYTRYNRVTDSGQPITLSYTDISYADIIKHGALYNGLSGSTIYGNIAPAAPGYVFDHYGSDYASAPRDGILPAAIRVAKQQLGK